MAERSFSVETTDLKVSVSGTQEKVSQVYSALQGVLNNIIPGMIAGGGDLQFSLEDGEAPSVAAVSSTSKK